MHKQEKIVREIMQQWSLGPEETVQAFRDHCAEDFVWWNSVRGTVNGIENACRKLGEMQARAQFQTAKAVVRSLVVSGTTVIVERYEKLYRADGSFLCPIPVVGVIEFEGDKIKEWRDYCADWMTQLVAARSET